MKLLLDIRISEPEKKIDYQDKILMTGSCFTEHIGDALAQLKFDVLQNPNGIIFDPASVAGSIISYIENRQYTEQDLFFMNELWQSWQHHSKYSGRNQQEVLERINSSQQNAHAFLQKADWLVITLGTSYSYRLEGTVPVANCHRAPAQMFTKYLMRAEESITALDTCLYRLFQFNPNIRIIFTVSPVRHIRDGVVENSRSKARLIETVHHLAGKFDRIYYFPSYEIVIDVLRDYRFYDADLVHPNYQGTAYVIEQFMQHYVNERSQELSKEIEKLVIARKHKAFQPETEAHKKFLRLQADRTRSLLESYPYLNLREELAFFEGGG